MASEKLISKVCANFAEELEGRLGAKFNKILETLAISVDLNKTVSNHDLAIRKIETNADDIEQHTKRNSLRFYGLGERRAHSTSLNANSHILSFLIDSNMPQL
ncbi:hypothetical protein JTB14_031342 [Gonioctena quinquepunctata]|nr:hypothetical protein JTB14_031342 [Gonioctena quinquepunctata]